jgi:hypothetical protein
VALASDQAPAPRKGGVLYSIVWTREVRGEHGRIVIFNALTEYVWGVMLVMGGLEKSGQRVKVVSAGSQEKITKRRSPRSVSTFSLNHESPSTTPQLYVKGIHSLY